MKLHRVCFLVCLILSLPSVKADSAFNEDAALSILSITTEKRAKAIVELSTRGTAKSVPVLIGLLSDIELHDYARNALELIPDPTAGEALVAALKSKLPAEQLAGVVITLGDRRVAAAVPALVKLASDPKNPVGDAAMSSLALIANDEAGVALANLVKSGAAEIKLAAAHAALRAGDRLAKGSATRTALADAVQGADVPDHLKTAAAALK